ncbi:unnamed protein product [Anisakis simplex]|uniref:Frizzled domain-containing protein n=1 Tax=Anisakis simplex TaxID=6269 RepID=A0A0M3KBR7_ANISI|nr:unnamed protein product [Anisakis simplex]
MTKNLVVPGMCANIEEIKEEPKVLGLSGGNSVAFKVFTIERKASALATRNLKIRRVVKSDNSCYHGKSDRSSEASDQRQKAQREGELQEKHESENDTSSKNEDHPHDDENGKDATTNDSFRRQKLSDIDAQHVDEHTDQSKSNQLQKQAVRFGIEMEIDQSKCKCVQSAGGKQFNHLVQIDPYTIGMAEFNAGKSGAFRVALSVCSLLIHFIVGTIGLYECPMDANIARFVLARSSLIIVDLIYLAGFAFLANPSKRLAHIPEIRHAGSFVLSIAGAICVYPYYVRVQHSDKKLRMYCSAICYWFAFGAATADLVFFAVLNVICCCSVLTSLHISCRNDSNQPTSENV